MLDALLLATPAFLRAEDLPERVWDEQAGPLQPQRPAGGLHKPVRRVAGVLSAFRGGVSCSYHSWCRLVRSSRVSLRLPQGHQ